MIGSDDFSPDTEPDPPVSKQVVEIIQHLQRLAMNCGVIVEVVTRNDVEEAWQARHEEPSTSRIHRLVAFIKHQRATDKSKSVTGGQGDYHA